MRMVPTEVAPAEPSAGLAPARLQQAGWHVTVEPDGAWLATKGSPAGLIAYVRSQPVALVVETPSQVFEIKDPPESLAALEELLRLLPGF